ncbi:MAG: lysine--tRNA ligase [Methanomassiliicoccales archaeon]|nr:lysine--tRNA ligase [Methanomassiliicoccales archaeon]
MHWADVIANTLISRGNRHLISTGISPSGFIHVGSLREAITAGAVNRAVLAKGADVKLIYLVDSFDPLRRRYAFLPESYGEEVGKPLCSIPCPCGEHMNYAHHFIQPFLDAISELGVRPEVYWTHELYSTGRLAEAIDTVIKEKVKVASILRQVTGRDVPSDFFPYNPRCPECGRFADVTVVGYEFPFVSYKCPCGHDGKADVRKDDGKLPWRIEWAAKWKILGVTCEPFGKDHAAAGGSYDTGVRFARDIFGIEPPYPIPYEFVQLKGKGQMHKSSGSVVTGVDALKITPAPVLNYEMLRYNPDRHIDYDPGLGILDIVDEYDRTENMYYHGGAGEREEDLLRAYELSQPDGTRKTMPFQVPYRHLVSVVQCTETFEGVIEVLKRTEHMVSVDAMELGLLKQRVDCVKYWLDHFAPEEVKFCIAKDMPQVSLTELETAFMNCLLQSLNKIEWEGDVIHQAVHECAKSSGLGSGKGFQALYQIFVNRRSGPRLGYFLSTLDRGFVIGRIEHAARM